MLKNTIKYVKFNGLGLLLHAIKNLGILVVYAFTVGLFIIYLMVDHNQLTWLGAFLVGLMVSFLIDVAIN